MDLSDDELQHLAKADRHEVDPPIEVETAMWSRAGQLDWWVKERQEWWVAYAVQTATASNRSSPWSGSEQSKCKQDSQE